jgi:thiamine-phosphate pyrophosphorylase
LNDTPTHLRHRAPLQEARLYGILDLGYVAPQNASAVAEQLIAGGVDILQLRAKGSAKNEIAAVARSLCNITSGARIPFIINDHPDIATRVGATGAHLGQEDGTIAGTRCSSGLAIIGRSTHSLDQAIAAEHEGADYIGFGPLFPTATKAGRPAIGLGDIARVAQTVKIPVFCIGGIDLHNLHAVLDAGARRVVIVSAILRAADITGYCRDVKAVLLARAL